MMVYNRTMNLRSEKAIAQLGVSHENTGSGVNIGDPVAAEDDDLDDTLRYSLGGTDAGSFSIDSTNGQLRTSAALDYEATQSYTVVVSVSDGQGGSDSITVTINIIDVDESPANRTPFLHRR